MLFLALATPMLAATWYAGDYAGQRAQRDLEAHATSAAKLYALLLRNELEKHRSLPLILADDQLVRQALLQQHSGAPAALNRKLERLAAQTRTAVVYVLNPQGLAIAASNWRLPTSFVGANYSFRPYFQDALIGKLPEHFALGAISRHPGLFVARRVDGPHGALGVVVAKVELDELERDWRSSGDPVFVVENHGVVLVTSVPSWRFRTLRPLDAATKHILRARFGAISLAALPLQVHGDTADLQGPGRDTASFVLATEPAPLRGWTLYLLRAANRAVETAALTARLAALSLAVLASLVGVGLLLRRDRAALRIAAQRQIQAELETRVHERTRALRDANDRLVDEMDERRRAEISRQQLQDELIQANRLATLGQVTAGVAHEINQPVAAIRTFAENGILLLDRSDIGTARQNLGLIADLTEKIGLITSELRAFSRKAKTAILPIPLDQAIAGAILLVGARARASRVALTYETKLGDQHVLADKVRLEQVVVNLLQNALDALDGRTDGRIRIIASAARDEVRVRFEDNGPGIDGTIAAALFTPFTTSKENGLGLGLVISRELSVQFGGDLLLDDSDGDGACFSLILKAA